MLKQVQHDGVGYGFCSPILDIARSIRRPEIRHSATAEIPLAALSIQDVPLGKGDTPIRTDGAKTRDMFALPNPSRRPNLPDSARPAFRAQTLNH
jgi:hypothetical protein